MMKIREIVDQIKSGKITALEIVESSLAKAKELEQYHSLLRITEDSARERAREIDKRISAGEDVGPLAGVPFINKDNILAFDGPTTASSKMLEDFQSPIQATVIEKLEAAGAIMIGKANLDSFAHGSSTENSAFGVTKNPVDMDRVPGGSSGGSASAVALGIAPFALGSDTGGSIRQPASHCGVVGIKPTYGLVSRFGAVAMSSSTDCIGCLTKNAEDADLVMSVIAGIDERDMTTYVSKYQSGLQVRVPSKIGVIKQFMTGAVDPEVLASTKFAIDCLRELGHEVDEIDIDEVKYALAIYYVVVSAEVASNLARYDGVRYGYRSSNYGDDLTKLYGLSRSEGFMTENKRRIIMGNYVLASGYFDAYYLKAQKVRTLMINKFEEVFKEYKFLVGPVSPEVAFKFGENTDDPLKMYMSDVMTTPANLAGLPALSLPSITSKAGLPIGVQIIGDINSDAEILALAKQLETKIKERA